MATTVDVSGRVRLPSELESQALTVLEFELGSKQGAFDADRPVDTFADLARHAGASVRREGDWLTLSPAPAATPGWSEQADAFYRGLYRWVQEGEVTATAADGRTWIYTYDEEGVRTDAATSVSPVTPALPTAPATRDEPPTPPAPTGQSGPLFTYPGQVRRDPEPEAPQPPAGGFGTESSSPPARTGPYDDEPVRQGGNRTVAMGLLLVVGVLLIVALAYAASGI